MTQAYDDYDAGPDATKQAEQSLLGELLFASAALRDVSTLVAPSDFRDERLGRLYGLMAAMFDEGGASAVNLITVRDAVKARQSIDEAEKLAKPNQGWKGWPTDRQIGALVGAGIPGAAVSCAKVVRSLAIRRAAWEFGTRVAVQAESGADVGLLTSWMVNHAKEIRDGARTTTLDSKSLADVLAAGGDDDTYDWVIPGLLERKDRLILTGAEGLGKSTLLRQLDLCAAGGIHPFTGAEFEPSKVLVIDTENSERQWRRSTRGLATAVRMAVGWDPAQAVQIACVARMDITTPGDLGAIHALIDEHEPDLLHIGPLYRLVPRSITSDDDAAPVLAALDSLRERGCALMLEAHAGHAIGKGGERDYRPRGSSALMGWPEFGFGLAPDTSDEYAKSCGRVEVIRWRGDRDERAWPLAMRRGGTFPWTDDKREPGRELPEHNRRAS